jgi:hypothetical protein
MTVSVPSTSYSEEWKWWLSLNTGCWLSRANPRMTWSAHDSIDIFGCSQLSLRSMSTFLPSMHCCKSSRHDKTKRYGSNDFRFQVMSIPLSAPWVLKRYQLLTYLSLNLKQLSRKLCWCTAVLNARNSQMSSLWFRLSSTSSLIYCACNFVP